MYIEFVGLPASGKTTLLWHLKKQTSEGIGIFRLTDAFNHMHDFKNVPPYIKKHSNNILPYRILLFQQKHQKLMRFVNKVGLKNPNELFLFHALTGHYQGFLTNKNIEHIYSSDEGFLHRGIALISQSRGKIDHHSNLMGTFLTLLPPLDLTIFIRLSSEEAFNRSMERGKITLAKKQLDLTPEQFVTKRNGSRANFKSRNVLIKQAIDYFQENELPHLVLDGEASVKENTEILLKKISDLLMEKHFDHLLTEPAKKTKKPKPPQ